MRLPLLLAIAATACACTLQTASPMGLDMTNRSPRGGSGDAGTEEVSDFGESQVLSSVADQTYVSSPGYAHATRAPYPSAVATGASIEEWVTASEWAQYAKIDPNKNGSGAKLNAGAVIVRAVLDASGKTTKLTLMAKGPPGYNPDLGDWWFGETTPDGAPLTADGGALTGHLKECYTCHLARSGDDFLFGVPGADRSP